MVSVLEFGVGEAIISVEWAYLDNGSVADNYSVSLQLSGEGKFVTTTKLLTAMNVPYDQTFTGMVVATNCVGSSTTPFESNSAHNFVFPFSL